jgi:hypothetical protein
MRQQQRAETVRGPVLVVHDRDLTIDQALAMRDDQARLAAHYADRVERALAAGQYGAMRRAMGEYRSAARQCRLLGERIRGEGPEQRGANGAGVVTRLAPRPGADSPPAGKAA